MMINRRRCPFAIGDCVVYKPTKRGIDMDVMSYMSEKLIQGKTYQITKIEDELYVTVDGYNHPGGGLYWTEFESASIQIKSNKELLDYLLGLADELKQLNENAVANELFFASRFYSGSPSEFLHEAYSALTNAQTLCQNKSYGIQLKNIDAVIKQIDFSFNKIGGA